MEKIKVQKTVFDKRQDEPFIWKDIKDFKFEDDDLIRIEYVDSYCSEINSYDAHYHAEVIRMVEETDEQFKQRIEDKEINEKFYKKRRYESYLKLKEEFENGKTI